MDQEIIKTPLDDVVFINTQIKVLNFKCERCGTIITKGRTIMKKRFRFDNKKKEKQIVVCDDCFKLVVDHYQDLFPDWNGNDETPTGSIEVTP